jgi:hypothetical protein
MCDATAGQRLTPRARPSPLRSPAAMDVLRAAHGRLDATDYGAVKGAWLDAHRLRIGAQALRATPAETQGGMAALMAALPSTGATPAVRCACRALGSAPRASSVWRTHASFCGLLAAGELAAEPPGAARRLARATDTLRAAPRVARVPLRPHLS